MRILLLAAALAAPATAGAWLESFDAARREAAAARRPILAEFKAVWCYSCYYLEREVLASPEFSKAAEPLTLLKLDVDAPEGRALKERYRVGFLPSTLLLDSEGAELGRIVGEQTRADFLSQLGALLSKTDPRLARLQTLLASGDLAAARKLRDAASGDLAQPEYARLSARLDLKLALKAKDPAAAREALAALAPLEEDCQLPYAALEAGPSEVLEPRLKEIVYTRVFGPAGARCADARSAIEALLAVYAARPKDPWSRDLLLARAQTHFAALSEQRPPGEDRNLDDNRRYFLELGGYSPKELDELYPKLIAAYPADGVYPLRYARNLLKRGLAERALPNAQRAVALGYGGNRLAAVKVQAECLRALGRPDPARELLTRELKAARGRFPKEEAELRALLNGAAR